MINLPSSIKTTLAREQKCKLDSKKQSDENDVKEESNESKVTPVSINVRSSDTVTKASSTSSTHSKPLLKMGTKISNKWEVIGELGSGGCGIVYKVQRIQSSNEKNTEKLECPIGTIAAMKAEYITKRYEETLKAEASVLRRMAWSVHFCRLYMAGSPRGSDLNIVVMTLVGRSLSYLRKLCPDQRFTLCTSMLLGSQCLNAISDLHSVGYLHRDIKASNFAIGAYLDTCRTVFLLDFGFARPYRMLENSKLRHRRPRNRAPFMGTDRYCSINTHARVEQSRRDDLWSFLYMVVEMITGTLPWRKAPPEELPFMKVKCMGSLLEKCPSGMKKIMEHLKKLEYASQPDYSALLQVLQDICIKNNFLKSDPFDWEAGGMYHDMFKELTDVNSLNSPKTQSSDSLSNTSESPAVNKMDSVATDGNESTRFETSWDELTSSIYDSDDDSRSQKSTSRTSKSCQSSSKSAKTDELHSGLAQEFELNKSIRMITASIKSFFTSKE